MRVSLPLIAALAVFSACEDDEVVDTTAPTLVVEHSEVVAPGGEFDLDLQLEDDLALGEVRVDIHNDFDAHEHGRLNAVPFEYTNVFDGMRGKKTFPLHEHIDIPANAATGPYHVSITYFDNAGNEGVLYVGSFEIADPAQSPSITILPASGELEPNADKILALEGTIEDGDGLDEVHIMVIEEHEEEAAGRLASETPLYNQDWELAGATSFDLATDITPAIDLSTAPAGHYELRIMARDMLGNVKVVKREIHVD